MANLLRLRQIQYNEVTDLLKEVGTKARSGELGSTPQECLANAQSLIEKGASSVEHALHKFITADPGMNQMKARVKLLYKRAEPVLITGPTGTGKELLAKALTIPGQPFVAENCAGIPENLVESIFFGHRKGAFTGAHDDHEGLLEQAGEGIIFLDEIGDLPLNIQAKFLRAIQENEIRRVGSTHVIDIQCRFVAATKYDLEKRVEQKLFREDLYARLFTYRVHVTGLVDRKDDIPLITKSKVANPERFSTMPPFEGKVLEDIYRYNVRGIEAALARWRAYGSYD